MNKLSVLISIAFSALSACTYNIKPSIPALPKNKLASAPIECNVLLLIPQEFSNKEFVSSFEDREVRVFVGAPAAKAVENMVRSQYSHVETIAVAGDGTLDFIKYANNIQSKPSLIIRPRFQRLDSSLRLFKYNFEFVISTDIAGLSSPITPSGMGMGTAGLYTESVIQKAVSEALSNSTNALATELPKTCK
ncbi:MAG: hypothetical protein HOP25_03820 [Methylotenera sp.]|nr:hypothetical protein [Methylotenera sp.]